MAQRLREVGGSYPDRGRSCNCNRAFGQSKDPNKASPEPRCSKPKLQTDQGQVPPMYRVGFKV